MSEDLFTQVSRALAGRFHLERELGRGGMGVVFLGTDLNLGAARAIKVLRPEVGAVLGPERFLREIAIEVGLRHPHVLPLIESGEAGGFLYFTMPFIEGPTVRDRIAGDGALALHEAVRLTSEVADALAYAHQHGIIHRDIKPENILLSGDGVQLADFGIARVLGQGGAEALTSTGIAIGTPAYMSPEQAAADRVDERTDQYSLACVLYEMLTGAPPFTGPDARAVFARHASDPVPPLRTIRPGIPALVEEAVVRALAKHPADRWPSISAFAEAVRAAAAEQPTPMARAGTPLPSVRPRGLDGWRKVLPLAGLLVLGGFGVWLARRRRSPPPPDPSLIAVLPFTQEGALEGTPTASGLIGLLSSRLSGAGEFRIAPPGVDTRPPGSPNEALRLARRRGAGLVLTGQVFAGPNEVAIDASLRRSGDGVEIARVDRVSASRSNLLIALDRVAIMLLARAMGEPEYRISGLAGTPLEAAKAYLDGEWLFRRGQYDSATVRLERALAVDSTFALAGLLAYRAGTLGAMYAEAGTGWGVADSNSARLAGPDSMFYATLKGPRGDIPASYDERLREWMQYLGHYPDSPEAASAMAGELHFWGPATGNLSAHQHAANLLAKALAGDSGFAPNLEQLIDLAALAGDTAAVRRFAALFLSRNPRADNRRLVEWLAAISLEAANHTVLAESLVAHASAETLQQVILMATLNGYAIGDATLAVARLRQQAATSQEAWFAVESARDLAHNEGRPSAAPSFPPKAREWARAAEPLIQVIQARYWDGDSATAEQVVRARAPFAERTPPGPRAATAHYLDICSVGLWRAGQGQWSAVRRAVEWLGQAPETGEASSSFIPVCAAILTTNLEVAAGSPGLRRAVARLDSLAASVPQTNPYILLAANLEAAHHLEVLGDIPGALTAVRRRTYAAGYGEVGLSTYLREEGRLAALAGQRDAAIRAYGKYLALRRDPEPRLEAERAKVRLALAALTGEPR